jgi:phage gp29-like protein
VALTSTRLRELPLFSSSEWQSVSMVRSAMASLERGNFDRASQVVDAMGRDDRISGVLSTRTGALPSLPLELKPGTGRLADRAKKAAEDNWHTMFPSEQLSQLMEWGIMVGAAPARLDWTFGDLWLPRLDCWHPRPLVWRTDEECFYIGTQGDAMQKVTPGDGGWLLFTPYGMKRGWMKARARSLFVPWLVRQWGMRDWARYSEVHGMPLRKIIVPASASQEEQDAFLTSMVQLASENVIMSKRVAQSEGTDSTRDFFDVQLVEALGRSTEAFEKLIELANTCVAVNLLGQNLSTEVKGGSFAAAVAHTAIRNDILQSDAELLSQCLVEQVLRRWALINFGSEDAAPIPSWKTKPSEDRVSKGQALMNLGDGIKKLQATGAHPDIDQMLDDDGIPWKEPASEPPAPAPGPLSAGGAQVAANPIATLPRAPRAAQASLDDGVGKDVPAAIIAGQFYADAVASAARDEGTRVLGPDLADLMAAIERASSFEGLRLALEQTYKGMQPDRLAKVMREALVMAQLSGMHAVLEEAVDEADA